jgi:transcriptional regulator with XRE-family HTH domain
LAPIERDVAQRLGPVIRRARLQASLSQTQLAAAIGLGPAGQKLLSRHEVGDATVDDSGEVVAVQWPPMPLGRLQLIARHTGTTVARLLHDAEVEPSSEPSSADVIAVDTDLSTASRHLLATMLEVLRRWDAEHPPRHPSPRPDEDVVGDLALPDDARARVLALIRQERSAALAAVEREVDVTRGPVGGGGRSRRRATPAVDGDGRPPR